MRRYLLAALCGALLAPAAAADRFPDAYAAPRAEMNALGDKALAGDSAAFQALQSAAGACASAGGCAPQSPAAWRAAAAATNLGWLFWTKEAYGAGEKQTGMGYYARAATLGSPQGLYQVAACMRDECLDAGLRAAVFADVYKAESYKPFFGGKYERLKAASSRFGQAAEAGLVAAAVDKVRVDNELVGMARDVKATWDEGTVAIHGHFTDIIAAARTGLASQPTAEQRTTLEQALANAEAQASNFASEAAAARQRLQNGPAPARPASSAPSSGAPSKGENYASDKTRARQCVADSVELRDWRRDLDDWARDMRAWDKELDETRRDLELYYQNDSALRNSYNADVDAFNAEGREYDAEQGRYNAAADAYNAACRGSFNHYAIQEECTGSAAESRFCKSF
ncbi:MAG: hypothetical protein KDA53_14030 [Hyphomonas sp.]|nr:hypothetical protein [Hyphomonas sp.]